MWLVMSHLLADSHHDPIETFTCGFRILLAGTRLCVLPSELLFWRPDYIYRHFFWLLERVLAKAVPNSHHSLTIIRLQRCR
jgi:hypothetical protein